MAWMSSIVFLNLNVFSMPIPEPKAGEKQADYIQRCMEVTSSEAESTEQALAICYAKWKEGK
jgi:hypothetical protein